MTPVSNVRPAQEAERSRDGMHQFLHRLHTLYAEVEQFSHLVSSLMQELAGYETVVGAPEGPAGPAPDEEFLRAYV